MTPQAKTLSDEMKELASIPDVYADIVAILEKYGIDPNMAILKPPKPGAYMPKHGSTTLPHPAIVKIPDCGSVPPGKTISARSVHEMAQSHAGVHDTDPCVLARYVLDLEHQLEHRLIGINTPSSPSDPPTTTSIGYLPCCDIWENRSDDNDCGSCGKSLDDPEVWGDDDPRVAIYRLDHILEPDNTITKINLWCRNCGAFRNADGSCPCCGADRDGLGGRDVPPVFGYCSFCDNPKILLIRDGLVTALLLLCPRCGRYYCSDCKQALRSHQDVIDCPKCGRTFPNLTTEKILTKGDTITDSGTVYSGSPPIDRTGLGLEEVK